VKIIPHTRGGMLWRFLVAAIVVIGATAATTAVAGLLQINQLVIDISGTKALQSKQVTLPHPGQPQTILIIGSDHRAGEPFSAANTDTMLLVRLNASSSTINLMSIPRDLEVQIPGYGTAKINSAYSDGGPNLMIKTIRQNVFPDLNVNHIVDVNFAGFSDLVDAIGCVYSDVDHRYYNNTAYTDFSSIDIQPGYQRLCGDNQADTGALAFVRFRHTDSDLVRNARQQDFIRWAKDQYGLQNLISHRDQLLRIFGNHAQTDHNLHTTDGLIEVFNLVINSDGNTIKQIKFPAQFQPCNSSGAPGTATVACYVTATSSAEQRVYDQFMTPTPVAAHKSSSSSAHEPAPKPETTIPTAGLISDMPDGRSQAARLTKVKMPIYFPRLIKPGSGGSTYCLSLTGNCNDGQEPASEYATSYPRGYIIRDQRGVPHTAYRMTLTLNPVLGEYYGVQGTTWLNPPLLASPSGFRTVAGKRLELFTAGGKLTTVAWRPPQAVYWISNTLTTDISNRQMVSIAASLTRATG
jgi:LCP family protein required for cell wall assembly